MTFTTRLCIFALLSLAGVIAWHWTTATDRAPDVAALAVQQFQNSDAVAVHLQQASLAQSWWPLLGPALWVLLACVMFWEDVERLWDQEDNRATN
jgi:hypothetical protein